MKTINILIADDEELICESLKKKFTRLGYVVHVTNDGEETLKYIEKHLPDIVLLDVKMPKLSGIEVCRRIKSKRKTKHIFIIMFSARAELKDISIAEEVGADSYLCKPVPFTKIKDQIEIFADKLK